MKEALKQELVAHLRRDLETIERAHAAAREGATGEEAKPENDKDTRALEQSYLARGQAARAAELRTAIADLSALPLRAFDETAPAALGALVTIIEDGEIERSVLIAPHGGGARLAGNVQVVTPQSPLGRALVGRRTGDSFELVLAQKTRTIEVARVA